jgi:hypothetical protein
LFAFLRHEQNFQATSRSSRVSRARSARQASATAVSPGRCRYFVRANVPSNSPVVRPLAGSKVRRMRFGPVRERIGSVHVGADHSIRID